MFFFDLNWFLCVVVIKYEKVCKVISYYKVCLLLSDFCLWCMFKIKKKIIDMVRSLLLVL